MEKKHLQLLIMIILAENSANVYTMFKLDYVSIVLRICCESSIYLKRRMQEMFSENQCFLYSEEQWWCECLCVCASVCVYCTCMCHNVNVHTSWTGTFWHNKYFRLLLAGIPAQETLILVVLIVGAAHWGVVVVALQRGKEKRWADFPKSQVLYVWMWGFCKGSAPFQCCFWKQMWWTDWVTVFHVLLAKQPPHPAGILSKGMNKRCIYNLRMNNEWIHILYIWKGKCRE